MDADAKANWLKIKTHLESVGSTNNMFYQRAVAISAGGPDPLSHVELGQTIPSPDSDQ